MKYFIPYKLNRSFIIYNYAIQDFLLLIALLLVSIYTITFSKIPLWIFAFTLVMRFRFDNFPLSTHLTKRIKFIFRKNLYTLSECDVKNNKVR